MKELNIIKKNLAQQVEQSEQDRLKAQVMHTRVEELKKVGEDEKKKMEQLVRLFYKMCTLWHFITLREPNLHWAMYINLFRGGLVVCGKHLGSCTLICSEVHLKSPRKYLRTVKFEATTVFVA